MSQVLHVGLFAGGLCLGAAAGALLTNKSQPVPAPAVQQQVVPPPSAPGAPPASRPGPSGASGLQAIPFFSREVLAYSQGLPGPVADVLEHQAYVSAYDRRLRHPAWTAEHITPQSLVKQQIDPATGKAPDRKYSVFKEDERIPELFRAKLADYFRSGYDRGHMVPASDAKRSQRAMDETFFLTNICPQVGEGFNRDYWAYFEEFTRGLTKRFSDLYVFTIPLYLPQPDPAKPGKWKVSYEVIGNPPNVAVPTHFAKVILAVDGPKQPALPAPGKGSAALPAAPSGSAGTGFVGLRSTSSPVALGAFVIPNAVVPDEVPLRTFSVPVDSVERAAGLTLFPPAIKNAAKALCDCAPCEIVKREWPDRAKGSRSPSPAAPPSPQPGARITPA